MKYIVNHINDIQNYQPIFRDTPCCLGSYVVTHALSSLMPVIGCVMYLDIISNLYERQIK